MPTGGWLILAVDAGKVNSEANFDTYLITA
jgi:hypothetical protein